MEVGFKVTPQFVADANLVRAPLVAVMIRPDRHRGDGTPIRQWSPDGSVRTCRRGGTSTERVSDGTTLDMDAFGHPVREA